MIIDSSLSLISEDKNQYPSKRPLFNIHACNKISSIISITVWIVLGVKTGDGKSTNEAQCTLYNIQKNSQITKIS